MKFIGYTGPYGHGTPVRKVADDGTVWREATPKELAEAPDDQLVWSGKDGTEPKPKSEYYAYRLPGNFPFLVGISALMPVYVPDQE
jgi:hypothetical protein